MVRIRESATSTSKSWVDFQKRGQKRQSQGNLIAALADFSEAIDRSLPQASLHFLRASVWDEVGDFSRALKDYEAGLVLDPDNETLTRRREAALQSRANMTIRHRALIVCRRASVFIKRNADALERNLYRRLLPMICARMIQNDAYESLPVLSEDDDPELIHETFVDGPLTVEDAIKQASMLRTINERVKDGFYEDKLMILSCLEKSGSTTMEICIREMLTQTAKIEHELGIQKSLRWGPFSFVGQLHPKVLLYAFNGGVLRSVLQPLLFNCSLLNIWGCKHVILFRHPADRLVGRYCDPTPEPLVIRDQRRWRRDPQYLIPDIFHEHAEMEIVFDELISGGYLLDTLNWMANWLRVRDETRSVIVRYEDMQHDSKGFFADLHQFLFEQDMEAELCASISGYFSNYRREMQPGNKQARRYPKGYSGGVGICRSYFTEKNLTAYKKVVNGFLEIHPYANQLLEVYPNLTLE